MTIDEENRIKWKKIKINFDEAITIIKNQIFSNKEYVSYIDISSEECYEFIKAIETVLQELDKKDKEIQEKDKKIYELKAIYLQRLKELIKADNKSCCGWTADTYGSYAEVYEQIIKELIDLAKEK